MIKDSSPRTAAAMRVQHAWAETGTSPVAFHNTTCDEGLCPSRGRRPGQGAAPQSRHQSLNWPWLAHRIAREAATAAAYCWTASAANAWRASRSVERQSARSIWGRHTSDLGRHTRR